MTWVAANWPVLAAALAVVVALAAVAFAVTRMRRVEKIDAPEAAAEAADAALGGFLTVGAVVGADGAAALAVDGQGRVAVCRRDGSEIAVHEVVWSAIRATPDGMVVDTGARNFGEVLVAGIDALDVRRLAPQLTR